MNHPGRLLPLLVLAAFLAPVISGCGGGKGNKLPKVTGTVNVDGKPADGAVLQVRRDSPSWPGQVK